MPLYEYKCQRCGEVFEVLQQFSDAPLEQHAGCGGSVERLLSSPSFQFKGSGWYVTDYGRKNGGSHHKSSADKPAESKPESKPVAPASTETTSKP